MRDISAFPLPAFAPLPPSISRPTRSLAPPLTGSGPMDLIELPPAASVVAPPQQPSLTARFGSGSPGRRIHRTHDCGRRQAEEEVVRVHRWPPGRCCITGGQAAIANLVPKKSKQVPVEPQPVAPQPPLVTDEHQPLSRSASARHRCVPFVRSGTKLRMKYKGAILV
jgi:hypothetical protein